MPNPGLKALCRFDGEADLLVNSLVECGFIEVRAESEIAVIGWGEKNSQLLAAWDNGAKGGRPRNNPKETHGKPIANPTLTGSKPIREEKSREDETRTEKRREKKKRIQKEIGSFFDSWWEEVPSKWKTGKVDCRAHYAKAVESLTAVHEDPADFLLQRWLKYMSSPKSEFKYGWEPRAWLRDGHYSDDDQAWFHVPKDPNAREIIPI